MDQKVEETFTVVYNNCYGGFGMSSDALNEYNKRLVECDPTAEPLKAYYSPRRDDQILIDLCMELGDKVNGNHSKLKLKSFPIKYKKFLKWSEYDGNESVTIDYTKYVVHQIRGITEKENGTMDEIRSLLKEYESEIFRKFPWEE